MTGRSVGSWDAVRLTQARQVAVLIGVDDDALPDAGLDVRTQYAALRDAGDLPAASEYLGHALPRPDVVDWAARVLTEEAAHLDLPRRSRQALDTALRWLGAPSDTHRRAAHAAAGAAPRGSAERYLGFAVFYSGGTVAAADLPPVLPPAHACARYCVGAIEQAAYRSGEASRVFARALALGEAVAERGAAALDRTG